MRCHSAACQAASGLAAPPEIRRPALLPGLQPVGAVGDVAFEQRRQLLGQLEAHHRVGLAQVAAQPGMRRDEARIAQRRMDAPGQPRRRQRRSRIHAGQRTRQLLPQPQRQKTELQVGADAGSVGHGQAQPAAQRGVGHDHRFGIEHAATAGQALQQQIAQALDAVGVVDVQHGRRGSLSGGFGAVMMRRIAGMLPWRRLMA